jgi:hypothetical protein
MDVGKPVSVDWVERVLMGVMDVGNSLRKVAGRPPVGMAEGLMGSGVPEEVAVEEAVDLLVFSSSDGVFAGGAADDDAGVALPTEGTLGVGVLVGDAWLGTCAG